MNWHDELKKEFGKRGDDFKKRKCTLTLKELKQEFEEDCNQTQGRPFTAWGKKYVYFPLEYDGAEWIGYAPRYPCDEICKHQ